MPPQPITVISMGGDIAVPAAARGLLDDPDPLEPFRRPGAARVRRLEDLLHRYGEAGPGDHERGVELRQRRVDVADRHVQSRLEELVMLVDQAVAGTELGVAVHRAQLSPFGSRPLAGPVAQARVGPEPPVLDATADGLRGRSDAGGSAPT